MKVENKVMPNEKQMEEFLEEGHDEPIFMVNLLKFKDKAEYPDKRESNLSGKEAYAIYSKEVVGHLEKVGGKPIFGSEVTRLMLGEAVPRADIIPVEVPPPSPKLSLSDPCNKTNITKASASIS